MAREPGLACGSLETSRWVCERTPSAREGSGPDRRVGKMEKVVKRRGVGVLVSGLQEFLWRYRVGSLGRRRQGHVRARVWDFGLGGVV